MSNEWKDWTFDTVQEKVIQIGLDKIESYQYVKNNDWLFRGYYLNKNKEKVYNIVRYDNGIKAYCVEGKEQNNAK